jgi:pimeloyl-ACP methyl ester carboxylesterase
VTDRLVDVDGYRLAIRVTGTNGPPVVLQSSAGGRHAQWSALRRLLGDATCMSYGRPGTDGSDPLPSDQHAFKRPASWAADQLHRLLRAADIPPPYVLVGSSIGGWIADRFAADWPDEVAGLVQLDATYITPIPGLVVDTDDIDDAYGAGITFSWTTSRAELDANPPTPPRRAVVLSRAPGTVPLDIIDRYWQPLTPAEVDRGWHTCQVEWARRLHAIHIAAKTGGHLLHKSQPELVAFVIRQVLIAARHDIDLTLDPTHIAIVGGVRLPGSR